MLKLYIGEKRFNISYFVIFSHVEGYIHNKNKLFQTIDSSRLQNVFEIVASPEKADYFAIPYPYFSIKKHTEYIQSFTLLAKRYKKKILIFAYGDAHDEIAVPQSIVFRTSQYRHLQKENEIIMPAYVEDLLKDKTFEIRTKGAIPTVGFVGQASFNNIEQRIKYVIKVVLVWLQYVMSLNRTSLTFLPGKYIRRKAIAVCKKSSLVISHFIMRKEYSGHINSIEKDPETVREEYIHNIVNSDFTLAPKGDGNYSLRFFEVLSAGRIPVLIDTDMILPMEDTIDYKSFILRIPMQKLDQLDKEISTFYEKLSNEEFALMQQKARQAFLSQLEIVSFFTHIFSILEAAIQIKPTSNF